MASWRVSAPSGRDASNCSNERVTERTDWAQRLDGELAGVRAEREKCIQLLEDSERVTERTDWAARWRVG